MATGVVLWFNVTKGYGFISQDAQGLPDVFVHIRDLPGFFGRGKGQERGERGGFVAVPDPVLEEGQRVMFEIADGPKGPRAKNIRTLPPVERGAPIVEMVLDLGIK